MRRIGCLTPFGALAGVVALLAVAGVALATGGTMFSPGLLNAVGRNDLRLGSVTSHAELGGDCAACHIPPWGGQTMGARCLACHANIQAQIQDPSTLHGALSDGLLCRNCHTEHKGSQAALTRMDFKTFPHDVLGFSLATHRAASSGKPFACTDCHLQDLAHFDRAQCEACHRNDQADFVAAHTVEFGNDCLACHDGLDRFSKGRFDHTAFHFVLAGKHASLPCSQCHTNARSLTDFSGAPQYCVDCHRKDDAHKSALGTDCAKCHTPDDWKKAAYDHSQSAFKLVGQHVDVACAQCHVNDVFRGTSQKCIDCHRKDDAHKDALGMDCAKCHTPEDWKKATFDHSLSIFKLTGKHVDVACTQCHVNNVFKGTPQKCIDCHRKDDAHKGALGANCAGCHTPLDWKKTIFDHNQSVFKLIGQHMDVTCAKCHTDKVFKGTPQKCIDCHRKDDTHKSALGTNCARCHTPLDWKKTIFDHNQSVFKLVGKHANAACARCHSDTLFKGTPQACVDCHRKDDKHNGAFGTDCAQCHTPEDWKQVTFDHNRAAFRLTGQHVNVACARCHVNGVFAGTPQACAACHAEPAVHRGQFGTECAQCHNTDSWQGATFNHTFPLDHGEGRTIACATCHTNPSSFGEYTCYGCHEHDPAKIENKHREEGISNFSDCVQCHPAGNKEGGGGDD